jgi:DNA-binding IclR family transcriptional regulator
VKSCSRALDVLHFFASTGASARTIDVSGALNIPNSSADEILRTLTAGGYLSYHRATKRYAPSYKLPAMAQDIKRSFFGGDGLSEMLNDLRTETGATVYLTLQNDCWVESVAEIEGGWKIDEGELDYPNELLTYEGDRWLPGTNFAAAMLAQQSNVEIIDLAMRAQKLGLGPSGPCLSLVRRVARTRARGFSVYRQSQRATLDSIAIPLRMSRLAAPYAVGIVGKRLFDSDDDVMRMVRSMQHVVMRHSAKFR